MEEQNKLEYYTEVIGDTEELLPSPQWIVQQALSGQLDPSTALFYVIFRPVYAGFFNAALGFQNWQNATLQQWVAPLLPSEGEDWPDDGPCIDDPVVLEQARELLKSLDRGYLSLPEIRNLLERLVYYDDFTSEELRVERCAGNMQLHLVGSQAIEPEVVDAPLKQSQSANIKRGGPDPKPFYNTLWKLKKKGETTAALLDKMQKRHPDIDRDLLRGRLNKAFQRRKKWEKEEIDGDV